MNQVHKETLTSVDNALPNRQGLEVEIFGMEGVPEEVRQQHDQRVTQQYYEALAERQAATGNPTPGSGAQTNAPKKPKLDDPKDLKARLAAFKAKKAAGPTANSSGNATPIDSAQQLQSPAPASASLPLVRLFVLVLIGYANTIVAGCWISCPCFTTWCPCKSSTRRTRGHKLI